MPELPEVETMRRGLLRVIGQKIIRVEKPRSKYRPIAITPNWRMFRRLCENESIIDVRRIAKRVLVDLSNQQAIVFQPKMAGLLVTENPPSEPHVRFRFHLEKKSRTALPEFIYWDRRGLGTVNVWSQDEQMEFLGPAHLGPDALIVSETQFYEIFCANKREVKIALLDQKLVAGIGNLYASEILHRSAVHPTTRCNRISKRRWSLIWQATLDILNQAIEYEGSTLSDGTYRNAVSDPGRYQNEHAVYGRAGEICFSCGEEEITRIVQAQRSTFFCRSCQKR